MPIYKQSVNVRKITRLRWYATWRIFLRRHCILLCVAA